MKVFLKFQVFVWSYWIDFCMGWEMEVWYLISRMWISGFPRTTCERGFLSSRHVFVKSQWSQLSRFNSGYSSLYPWSLSVYCASITGFFVTVSLWYNIKPGIVILLPLSFVSELFWLCGVLGSSIWMSGLFCGSLKRVIGLWMGTTLNLGKTFENMAIFTVLILPVYKYMRSRHLLLYSNSFFTVLEFQF